MPWTHSPYGPCVRYSRFSRRARPPTRQPEHRKRSTHLSPNVPNNTTAMPPVQRYQIVTKPHCLLNNSTNDSSRKFFACGYFCLARATGLEPATTGSTVRYSNQLSYAPVAAARPAAVRFNYTSLPPRPASAAPALFAAAWRAMPSCIIMGFPANAECQRSGTLLGARSYITGGGSGAVGSRRSEHERRPASPAFLRIRKARFTLCAIPVWFASANGSIERASTISPPPSAKP